MKKIDKKHSIAFVLIVTTLLVFFYFMFQILTGKERSFSDFFIINLLPFVLIAWMDFLIINNIYKYLKIRNIYLHVALDLFISSLFSVFVIFLVNLSLLGESALKSSPEIIKSGIFIILWNSIVVLLIEIFFYNQQHLDAENKITIMEKEKIQYQYDTLKAQINPHFLFNSLNVLSSLAYQDAEKANLFAKKMSGVYRYLLLTNERPLVTLQEELAFLDSYIFLEQIRFGDNLRVEVVNKNELNRKVIPVSLQLLVENAIKHNITTYNNPLMIRIEIAEEGITVSNNLQLRTTADCGGIGLKNLQKQYALYNKTIEVIRTDTEFTVKLSFLDQ
ncbi:Probable sensor-like histidine kinase YehU [Chryseobacterium nakagawai]|uniref:Histidine kinase n=2 Tax=Chryseobacterium nakagawai TaxID=1241982 RepID=A0AAD0YRK6_CHRNA|nr:histidine kinase [Chryseobacterium nakagawai]VEH21530.1 Probable sensor-like histidine kinase YehU [Chryseobacterium nakagawai]